MSEVKLIKESMKWLRCFSLIRQLAASVANNTNDVNSSDCEMMVTEVCFCHLFHYIILDTFLPDNNTGIKVEFSKDKNFLFLCDYFCNVPQLQCTFK